MPQPYDIVFNIAWQANNAQLQGMLNGVRSQAERAAINVPLNVTGAAAAQRALRGTSDAAAQAAASLGGMARVSVNAGSLLENLASQAGLATRRLLGFGVASTVVYKLGAAIHSAVQEAIEFD